MRKIRLSDTDFEFFDYEITPTEYNFFQKHKDAFNCMWKEQGKGFWTKFTIIFRSFTVKHGVIKQMSCDTQKFENLLDQAFICIHENFVDGKESMARNFIEDVAKLAQNHDKFPGLDSKSFSRDPFYLRETRELFRHFFGQPDEKASYLKVYILSPIYLRFGGSACRCIKKWMEAPEMDPSDESYWVPPNGPIPTEPKVSKVLMCTTCLDDCGRLFYREKSDGKASGPQYIAFWSLGDPRFNDPKNPLYAPGADRSSDWRSYLSVEDFRDFLHYAKFKYGTEKDKCKDCMALTNNRSDPLAQEKCDTECQLDKQKKKKKKKKNKKKENEAVDDIVEQVNGVSTSSDNKENVDKSAGTNGVTKKDASTNFPSPQKDDSAASKTEKGTDPLDGSSAGGSVSNRKRRIVFTPRATVYHDYKCGILSTEEHRYPNNHLVAGFKVIVHEEKNKMEMKIIIVKMENQDKEIVYKNVSPMPVSTLLVNADMVRARIETLPYKMEWWEGNNFCVCVLDYEREERKFCSKRNKRQPTNFAIKVSNAEDETLKKTMFKLLTYVGKRKKRDSIGWTLTDEDVMTCILPDDVIDHEGLTITIMKGFRFEERLTLDEERSLFQPGIVQRDFNKKKIPMLLDCNAAIAVLKQEDGRRTLQELVECGESNSNNEATRKEEFKVRIARMISNPVDFEIIAHVDEDRVEEMKGLGLKLVDPDQVDRYALKEDKNELLRKICPNCGHRNHECTCTKNSGSGGSSGAAKGGKGSKGIKEDALTARLQKDANVDFEKFTACIAEQSKKTDKLFKFSASACEPEPKLPKRSPKKKDKTKPKKPKVSFIHPDPNTIEVTLPENPESLTPKALAGFEKTKRALFEGGFKLVEKGNERKKKGEAERKEVKEVKEAEEGENAEENGGGDTADTRADTASTDGIDEQGDEARGGEDTSGTDDDEDDSVDEYERDDEEEDTEDNKEEEDEENGSDGEENGNDGEENGNDVEENGNADEENEDKQEGTVEISTTKNDEEVQTKNEVTTNGELRQCANCYTVEPCLRTYKKCQKCKVEGIVNARYYCGRDCQVADWTARHKKEHKENLLA